MKTYLNTYIVYYSTPFGERASQQYCENEEEALNKVKENLRLFGYGNESDFEVERA